MSCLATAAEGRFRLMVKSRSGWAFEAGGWHRRSRWSTWSGYATREAAEADAEALKVSGPEVTVIAEDGYDDFCIAHGL